MQDQATSPVQTAKPEVIFISIPAFKRALKIEGELRYKADPIKGTRMILTDDGRFFKVQKTLNDTLPKKFLLEKGKPITEACLVNVKEGRLQDQGAVTE
jgi:hypothetical protein